MAVTTHRTRSGVEISYAPFAVERLKQQLAFTEITAEDLRRITSFQAVFVPRIPQMVDAFYDHLWEYGELRAVVERYSSIPQLKKSLEEYLHWFMRGKVDLEYANYRYRVGAVHNKIGLAPNWYLGMFHVFETHIINMICESGGLPQQQAAAIGSWMKLLSFDMQLAMDAYIEAYTAERVRRIEQLQAMQQTLATSSHDLAASSEELSASSEEMVSSVTIVARDSQEMQEHTRQIEQTAATGVERMQQVADTIRQAAERMAAMREKVSLLADSSREMEKILKTVDGIAKQTNLLSLNAAIEAARAGQHGRGFAVVADEVRKLSDRTSASLKEISKLIATSDRHVDDVRATAEEAGQIAVAGANESTTAEQEFAEIARLVAESAERIGSITQAMSGLSEMSDHLKCSAESNAHLATTLADLARNEA